MSHRQLLAHYHLANRPRYLRASKELQDFNAAFNDQVLLDEYPGQNRDHQGPCVFDKVHGVDLHLLKIVFESIILIFKFNSGTLNDLLRLKGIKMDLLHQAAEELVKVAREHNLAKHQDADVLNGPNDAENSIYRLPEENH